jgi:hypothetical protein
MDLYSRYLDVGIDYHFGDLTPLSHSFLIAGFWLHSMDSQQVYSPLLGNPFFLSCCGITNLGLLSKMPLEQTIILLNQ